MAKHTREFLIKILRDCADRKRRNEKPTMPSHEFDDIALMLEEDLSEIEQLSKAIGLQMEEKHKHAAEARYWFEYAQEANSIIAKLQRGLVTIASHGNDLTREDCRRIARKAVELPLDERDPK